MLTADYSCMMNNSCGAEMCWMEAFESDSSVVNYLRLRFCLKIGMITAGVLGKL